MNDLIPMIHFFLESYEELQRILLNTDIHESYMFDVMDKKLDSNNKILSNQNELKIQNWQNISRVLKMISNSKVLSNGTNEIVNIVKKLNLLEEINNRILQNSGKYPSTSEYIRKYIKNS